MTRQGRKITRRDALRSQDDLWARFWEQINFLRSSASSFDNGNESEARRLAAVLRILFINSQNSNNLFEQLNLSSRLKMLNTVQPINPRNLPPTFGLVSIRMSADGARYVPFLENGPPVGASQLMPMNRWLSKPIGKRGSRQWSRQQLITWVANRDGGAHIDPELDEEHFQLSRENGLGWIFKTDDLEPQSVAGDFVLTSIRQIAYEVDKTVIRHVDRGDIPSSP